MCYNSTSPFLFLQTYYSLTIGYIQKEGNYFFKKVDGFFKKVDLFAQKVYLFCNRVICYVSFNKPKETTIEVVLRLLDLLISW